MILIDTNILARYLLQDIPDHSERCVRLFKSAGRGEIEIFIPTTVVAEITWLLIRQRGIPKQKVAAALLDLFQMRTITIENRRAVINAIRHMAATSGLSFVDCYHLTLAEELGMSQIYSFDKKMDRYPVIERIEPE